MWKWIFLCHKIMPANNSPQHFLNISGFVFCWAFKSNLCCLLLYSFLKITLQYHSFPDSENYNHYISYCLLFLIFSGKEAGYVSYFLIYFQAPNEIHMFHLILVCQMFWSLSSRDFIEAKLIVNNFVCSSSRQTPTSTAI